MYNFLLRIWIWVQDWLAQLTAPPDPLCPTCNRKFNDSDGVDIVVARTEFDKETVRCCPECASVFAEIMDISGGEIKYDNEDESV